MKKSDKIKKRESQIFTSIIVMIVLLICFSVASAAIAIASVSVNDNLFMTGSVRINLNNGQPVIREDEFLFEPGMRVKKSFFIRNDSSWAVYYKLYFENVEGKLADYIGVEILDGDKVLRSGKMSEMNKRKSIAVDDELAVGETRILTLMLKFPSNVGNEAQGTSLSFDLAADAVQTKNNPNREFDD